MTNVSITTTGNSSFIEAHNDYASVSELRKNKAVWFQLFVVQIKIWIKTVLSSMK